MAAAAAFSVTCLSLRTSAARPSIFNNQRTSCVSFGLAKTGGFSSLRTSRFGVVCAAKPETVEKVCEIVRKQLALPPESELTPDTSFTALGADSLDTVEIVMELEGAFDINVEEENSENITTVQEAADLIDKLVQKKAEA